MKNFELALAQINPIAGDFEFNAEKIRNILKQLKVVNCNFVITPEKSLCGYGLKDTIEKFPYLANNLENYVNIITKEIGNNYCLLGYADKDCNSVYALIYDGKILSKISSNAVIDVCGVKYGIILDSSDISKINNADVYIYTQSVCISSVKQQRLDYFIAEFVKKYKKPIIHINPVGATDSLSFEGRSLVYNVEGEIIARAKSFEEDLLVINSAYKNIINPCSKYVCKEKFDMNYEDELERTYKILIQGIRDYFHKCRIKRAVLGLSGGLDSTVSAVLLADAIGKENVYGISMPSKLTSNESKSDAKELAKNLGINFSEVSIKPMFETIEGCFNNLFKDVEKNWEGRYKKSFTPDNIQARSRAMYLWGVANEFSSCIPIATSDKSEAYMGYATINGDMSGGFAPILDITKTKLFALARWLNKNRFDKNVIPESIIFKKPGAELAIDPNTGKTLNAEDALMPYEFMDEIIWRIEHKKETYADMLESKFLYEKHTSISREQKLEWLDKFFKRMSSSIYKATIMPPAIITDYPTNIKPAYYQPITSGGINYRNIS